ncbi:MAG TPA: hypothetical protein P5254_08665 [Aquihabitans sp.]|nr:hypothetical protein [Aquihabitans sp.]
MQLPSCAQCGAPLPAVPADPAHPERCGACAARALQAPGVPPMAAPPTVPPPPSAPTAAGALPLGVDRPAVVVRTRPADGLLVGLAAAGIAGVVWWAIGGVVEFTWWHYAAALVGLIVGQGVVIGARRGGAVPAAIAGVLSIAVVVVAVYFIDRSQTISGFADQGRSSDIPLWQGAMAFWDDLHAWIDYDLAKAAGFLLAPVVAVVVAARPGASPRVIGR